MGLYEERVKRLREHVLRQQKKAEGHGSELTIAEIKAKLDELGIEFDNRANKATLLELLKAAQKEKNEEISDDDEGAE